MTRFSAFQSTRAALLGCLLPALSAQAQSVNDFTLVNALTDQAVGDFDPLFNGAKINLSKLPQINIVANGSGAIGSVVFTLNGQVFSTENIAPFALGGDNSGDFNTLELDPGSYLLEATAWSQANGEGTQGGSSSVDFTLRLESLTQDLSAGPDQFIVLPDSQATLDSSAPEGQSVSWTLIEGPSTVTFADSESPETQVSGLIAGSYVFEIATVGQPPDQVVVAVSGSEPGVAELIGERRLWEPLSLDFAGPSLNESDFDPSPFIDYRLTVLLRAPDGQLFQRPGFFDGDGQGGGNGNTWRIRFSPSQAGLWHYLAAFRQGDEVAVSLDPAAGSASDFSGSGGGFVINAPDPAAQGFLGKGRLGWDNAHYLRFANGSFWIKGGTDSPENFLAYGGFDNTLDQGGLPPGGDFLHAYGPHVADWEEGDPDWGAAAGRGIIGALNYLNDVGVNSIYFLPLNLGGDGQEVYPFLSPAGGSPANLQYDISKLWQWNQVFEHAQRQAIALHFVLNETEGPNEVWLDNGTLGLQRRLFYRELVARFGHHLALKWNLSEENDFSVPELREFASYIQAQDKNAHPITVHTKPNNFRDYDELLGDPLISATSIQYNPNLAGDHVEDWRAQSSQAGRPWVLDMDENNPAGSGLNDGNADDLRKRVLYDVYFSGGNIEWYAGYFPRPPEEIGGDITLEDFRTREAMWDMMRCARELMEQELPFWQMQPDDDRLSGEAGAFGGGEVFSVGGEDELHAIYLPDASPSGELLVDASGAPYRQRWFNPRSCQFADDRIIQSEGTIELGEAPSDADEDWVVLINRVGEGALFEDRFESSP